MVTLVVFLRVVIEAFLTASLGARRSLGAIVVLGARWILQWVTFMEAFSSWTS